jgi:hypothetical protein
MAADETRISDPPSIERGAPQFFKATADLSSFLEQGDLIPRSAPVIDKVLRRYHPYYVEKQANEMFAVLTQSCDLVKHDGLPKARYIALAPVRPLRLILNREFQSHLLKTPGGLYVLGSLETQGRYDDFLAKVINNNDSRYFFVPQRPELQITEDMCVLLPLSMSIRIEHYDACLNGRVAQINDLFQAKLGWLLGQQLSRVGTPDWSPEGLAQKVKTVSERSLSWLPDHEFAQIKSAVRKFENEHPGAELDEDEFTQMRKGLQNRRDLVITAVIDVLVRLGKLPAPPNNDVYQLRKALRRDPTVASYFPAS